MENRKLKIEFLDKNIFAGLKNLNYGFDYESINYFSESVFRLGLKRVEQYGLGIYGIELRKNGMIYDVYGYDDYSKKPTDSVWYNSAFNVFIATGENLIY